MVSCATRSGIELWKRYDHNGIYTGYIQGGLGAINLDYDSRKCNMHVIINFVYAISGNTHIYIQQITM